jgi:hypothetical protein
MSEGNTRGERERWVKKREMVRGELLGGAVTRKKGKKRRDARCSTVHYKAAEY